ncbi:exopolygalacturonase-like [Arachis stenosperma]|uniref:exopolygalacturonase-like n=1 Tax=Arachis stenosperma TaxID=217475 RepID=UPI0025ABD725|nr:exopolygalacturonase-like [Arachis stenosperma]
MEDMIRWMLLILFSLIFIAEARRESKVFNVKSYGAVANGNTDNSVAFLKAWNDACNWNGKAQVFIPKGTYMLNSIVFKGPCKAFRMGFVIKGILKAPPYPSLFNTDKWIGFLYVNKLTLSGGGTLDGQGASSWPHHNCNKNPHCPTLPITVRFDFINNGKIHDLKSINPKGGHFMIFGSENVKLERLKISAPGDSPNTDGIKIGESNNINITSATIATGDDCIAMISGAKNISIFGVHCGPGHGISVGSLGKNDGEKDVQNIVVKNCTFNGTSNGLRIKTWAASLSKPLRASNFLFQDIFMDKVFSPIIIDQAYCPSHGCSNQVASSVQISDVTYKNIKGSGSSEIGIELNCSKRKPCQNITRVDINLRPYGGKGQLKSLSSFVNGACYGQQIPPSCIG